MRFIIVMCERERVFLVRVIVVVVDVDVGVVVVVVVLSVVILLYRFISVRVNTISLDKHYGSKVLFSVLLRFIYCTVYRSVESIDVKFMCSLSYSPPHRLVSAAYTCDMM